MGGVNKYLLKVKALNGCKFQDVCKQTEEAVEYGDGKENVVYKILGEKMLLAIVNDEVEHVLERLNAKEGNLDITCTPLMSYESFAQNSLGLVGGGYETDHTKMIKDGRLLFWMEITLEYRGISRDELLNHWRSDAEMLLKLTKAGQLDVVLHKVVGERIVHVFISVPNGDTLDNLLLSMPLIKEMGNNVTVECKPVINM